jgi:hypothetical protein
MQPREMVRELVCVGWFVLVALAFFAPLSGRSVPMGVLTALYGGILMSGAVALVLPWAHQKGKNDRVE